MNRVEGNGRGDATHRPWSVRVLALSRQPTTASCSGSSSHLVSFRLTTIPTYTDLFTRNSTTILSD